MANISFDFTNMYLTEYQKRLAGASFFKYLDNLNISLDHFIKEVFAKENKYYFSCSSLTREVKRRVNEEIYQNYFLRPIETSHIIQENKTFLIVGDFIYETLHNSFYFKVKDIYVNDNETIKKYEKLFNFKTTYKQDNKKSNSDTLLIRNIIETTPIIYNEKNIAIINKWEEYLEFEKKFFSEKLGFYNVRSYNLIELVELKRSIENLKKYEDFLYFDDGNNYLYVENHPLVEENSEKIIVIEFEIITKNNYDAKNQLNFFINQEIELAHPKEALNQNNKLNINQNFDFNFKTKRIGAVLKPLEVVKQNENEVIHKFSKFWVDENIENFYSLARIEQYIQDSFSEFPILVNILSGDIALYKRGKQALDNIREGSVKNPGIVGYLLNVDNAYSKDIVKKESIQWSTKNLDEYQKEAIVRALNSNSIFLLQGPPGTGKTQTITEMVHQFNKMNKKVLLSSQTHVAIDNVLDRLPDELNILPIRLINSERKLKANKNFLPDKLVDNFYEKTLAKYLKTIDDFTKQTKEIQKNELEFEKVKTLINNNVKVRNDYSFLQLKQLNLKERINNLDNQIEVLKQNITDNQSIINFVNEFSKNGFALKDYQLHNLPLSLIRGITTLLNKYKIDDLYRIENPTLNDYLKIFSVYFSENHQFLNDYHELMKKNKNLLILFGEQNIKTNKQLLSNKETLSSERVHLLNELKKISDQARLLFKQNETVFNSIDNYFSSFFKDETSLNKIPTNDQDKLTLIEEIMKQEKTMFIIAQEKFNTYKNLYDQSISFLNNKFNSSLEIDRYKFSRYLLNNNANVFGITCNANSRYLQERNEYLRTLGLGNIDLNNIDFDVVIIDEVSKATFVELLIPILYGKSIILVGDHRQLPPMFKYRENMFEHLSAEKRISKEALNNYQEMVENSVFKNLFEVASKNKFTLLKQYRSHEQIMNIVNLFYEDKLQMGHKSEQNEAKKHYLDANSEVNGRNIFTPNIHTYWFNSNHYPDRSVSYEKKLTKGSSLSTSFYNEQEIYLTKQILRTIDNDYTRLLKEKVINEVPSIGIISLYGDQVNLLKREISKMKFKSLDLTRSKISTVDEFQGKEEDIIIVNFVRNNRFGNAGEFVRKFERINVALSRARKMLIMIGSIPFFSKLKVTMENSDDSSIVKERFLYEEVYKRAVGKIYEPNNYFKEEDLL